MGSANPKNGPKSKRKIAKSKRGPIPMKLRALPQSFWQQPNASDVQSPSECTPKLTIPQLETEHHPTNLEITTADIDLLFSLFSTLPQPATEGQRPVVRRGRPKKHVEMRKNVKDEDPYVTSVTVPEVKFQKEAMVETKVLALRALNEQNTEAPIIQTSYAQRLHDLAINL